MDVISVGEMLIDFTPGKEANSYVRNPGGAPANAVIAIARNGLSTGFAGKLGDDDFGRFLKETLEKEGVKVLCPELTPRWLLLPYMRLERDPLHLPENRGQICFLQRMILMKTRSARPEWFMQDP